MTVTSPRSRSARCAKSGPAGAEYILTGPQSLTQTEQVHAIGRAIGRSLRVEEMSRDAARSELLPVLGSS